MFDRSDFLTATPPLHYHFTVQELISVEARKRLFAAAYLRHLNIYAAADEVGISYGYAHALLRGDPLVKGLLSALVDEVVEESKLEAQEIIRKLRKILNANLGDYLRIEPAHRDAEGRQVPERVTVRLGDVSYDGLAEIGSFEHGKFGPKLKLQDALKAADMLGRYLKLWSQEDTTSAGPPPPLHITFVAPPGSPAEPLSAPEPTTDPET